MNKLSTCALRYVGLSMLHATIFITATSVQAATLAPKTMPKIISDIGKACKLSPKCVTEASSTYSQAMAACEKQFACSNAIKSCKAWNNPAWVNARNKADKALGECYGRYKNEATRIQKCNPDHIKIYSNQWVGLTACDTSYNKCMTDYQNCQNTAKIKNQADLNALVK